MSDSKPLIFPQVEPSPDEVKPSDLLDEIRTTINKYSILPKGADVAITLWIVGTYILDHLSLFALLLLTSPEKRCGKTTLLMLLGFLVRRPFVVSNITPASLYRIIEQHAPTLLIDEADTFIADKAELTGIINSGHTRAGARVLRCKANTFEPESLSTWCAKVIAMIKRPADTLMDRSIVIPLKRKLQTEKTERIRHSDGALFEPTRRKLERVAKDFGPQIAASRPDIPNCLNDRAAENWEPLIAIADLAGPDWGELARNAAITLTIAVDNDEDNFGILLLRDIYEIFISQQVDRIPSSELATRLRGIQESPWGDLGYSGLNARGLARMLAPFEIRPGTHRIGEKPQKGYLLTQFTDAFLRYLGKSVTPLQPSNDATFSANP